MFLFSGDRFIQFFFYNAAIYFLSSGHFTSSYYVFLRFLSFFFLTILLQIIFDLVCLHLTYLSQPSKLSFQYHLSCYFCMQNFPKHLIISISSCFTLNISTKFNFRAPILSICFYVVMQDSRPYVSTGKAFSLNTSASILFCHRIDHFISLKSYFIGVFALLTQYYHNSIR